MFIPAECPKTVFCVPLSLLDSEIRELASRTIFVTAALPEYVAISNFVGTYVPAEPFCIALI